MAYLQKYTTLEHMQADQVAKLQSDIIYRRLLEVSAAAQVKYMWSCWLGAECGVGGWLTVGYTRDHRSDDVLEALCTRSRLNTPKPKTGPELRHLQCKPGWDCWHAYHSHRVTALPYACPASFVTTAPHWSRSSCLTTSWPASV